MFKLKYIQVKTIIILFYISLVFVLQSAARDKETTRNSYLVTGFKQIKESANFGLVFSGADLNYGHFWAKSGNNRIISIENEIRVSIPFSKGIPALNIYLKPAEVSYLFCTSDRNHFFIGPLAKVEYDYTLYPQLQSAFDYWFTNFSLGINSVYSFSLANQPLSARLKFTILGFTSRQPDYRNPYWYDIGIKHAIRHLHSGLEFSALDQYNITDFELTWMPESARRVIWSYCFKYAGYFEAPKISMISHSIKLTFHPKKKIK